MCIFANDDITKLVPRVSPLHVPPRNVNREDPRKEVGDITTSDPGSKKSKVQNADDLCIFNTNFQRFPVDK